MRGFDVTLSWIAMSSEFGDVLVKHRHTGATTLLLGNGEAVVRPLFWWVSPHHSRMGHQFSVRIVDDRMVVGSSFGHVALYHLAADGSAVTLSAFEQVVSTAVLSMAVSAPLNVRLVCGTPEVVGLEIKDVALRKKASSVLPASRLPLLVLGALLLPEPVRVGPGSCLSPLSGPLQQGDGEPAREPPALPNVSARLCLWGDWFS